ncbi:endonuclease/exonuclease/phosphatase family protein [Endozoicomonas sp. SESOKO1]|uniref:endonuclease/exonuclease/phosphatase family protein n=1 Tax=Endozoicomonas sp. SESOKO1 TaxID=2828742 RepID=UPI002149413A|nr:endonuclease/exonuclease/phosphatase family protein [Endozoicomonas sp. SESOKO1]
MSIRTLTGAIRRRLHRQRCQYRSGHIHHSAPGGTPCQLNKNTLKLLSFNIQVGINTQQYRHYLTRSWQHILPHANRLATLDRIAGVLPDFDVVALQEADGGSIRSNFINQTEYLALKGHFPYWYHQINRNLGKLAQHSNGLLSRFEPVSLEDHKLPGLIPGRGAIVARFGNPAEPLTVVMMHLALSKRARNIQLSYIRDVVQHNQHVVLMGDMNTHADQLLNDSPLKETSLHAAHWGQNTFPSWQPKRSLDHILISPSLIVHRFGVINTPITDHLPVSVEIQIPDSVLIKA